MLLLLFTASFDDDALPSSLSDPLDELEETDALRRDLRLERLDLLCLRLDLERLRDECLRLDELLAARDDDFLLLGFRRSSESLSEDDSELLLCGDGERFFGATFFFSDVFIGTGLGMFAQMLNEMASRSRLRSSKKLSVSSFWKRLLLYDW